MGIQVSGREEPKGPEVCTGRVGLGDCLREWNRWNGIELVSSHKGIGMVLVWLLSLDLILRDRDICKQNQNHHPTSYVGAVAKNG